LLQNFAVVTNENTETAETMGTWRCCEWWKVLQVLWC